MKDEVLGGCSPTRKLTRDQKTRRFDTSGWLSYDAEEGTRGVGIFSISHIIIIFLVALIVFGPQKLPELARQMGKLLGEFRRATADLRGTFEEHMRELERETQTIQQPSPPAAKLPEPPVPTAAPSTAVATEGGASEPEKPTDGDTKPA